MAVQTQRRGDGSFLMFRKSQLKHQILEKSNQFIFLLKIDADFTGSSQINAGSQIIMKNAIMGSYFEVILEPMAEN